MTIEAKRQHEVSKYESIYGSGVQYTINERRRKQTASAMQELAELHEEATSLLDVGCGDGTWMRLAADRFGLDCYGCDPVSSLSNARVKTALASDLPYEDDSFDFVTCLDVMEHLVPEDTIPALSEIRRVMRLGGIITVNNNPSCYRGPMDEELHINIKPYEEWAAILEEVFGGALMLNNSGGNRVFLV